jgi:RNA polymerase sigma factor (sigma-70 family)
MKDDAALLHSYRTRNDEAAFAELVERHIDVVYFAALRRCGGNAHLAEEVAQKVFTTLAQKAGALERHAVLAGWLYVATRNVAANLLRDERTRRTRENEAWAMSERMRDRPEAGDGPVDWDQLRPVLDHALDELDDRDRNAILLRFFQNRTFADIAAAMHLKEDAARMRVTRALEKLRALLVRRGIASTSTALALALTTQAALAKPAGLVTSVTHAALTGVSAASVSGTAVLGFMSTAKTSGFALAVVALLVSLGGNAYLLSRPTLRPPAEKAARRVVSSTGGEPAPSNAGELLSADDLTPLRERLRAAGADDASVRSVMEGILRRRYRARLSAERKARLERGWWRDAERTWGTAESQQRLIDDPTLLRAMVTEPLERLLGPDPADVAEADAKYSFLSPELRERFGRIDRALPTGYSLTGEPAVDDRLRAEYEKTRKQLEGERAALLAALSPSQRDAYEMRFSRTATALAQQLDPLGATEQEFTSVYPLAAAYAKEYSELFQKERGAQRPDALDRRFAQQMIDTLGYDRALDFIWAGSTEYPAYARIATDAGLPSTTAGRAVQLAADTAERATSIHTDASLSLAQKTAALAELQKTARSQLDALIPAAAQARLAPAALEWVEALGQGRYKPIASPLPGRGNLRIITGTITVSAPPPVNRAPPVVPSRGTGG